ncbi:MULTISPECIES: GNAT family N-acetyltransferase [Pseudomonas]|uniref:N-acetyltransferase n=1 Tax=Pseudomonas prosekii TaxID=1148509 RepID=A0A1H2AVJ7_9PSED|nr:MULTISPECIES: GNAT family N-acetyltransferase [Pseudomonas]PKH34120.1 GNAT family N-acetyltransferase [Pseudomonas sp. 43NM1]PWE40063.1 N-acetyltransferase [Pseudomonas prosekii]SDT50065.1 Predicted N-acetyltransferase YhbS [Pseudomonas prosekii]
MSQLIRPATLEDIAQIEAIVEAAYSPYIERIGRKPAPMLDDYASQVLARRVHVLADEKHLSGFVVLIDTENYLLLDNVAVSPALKGQGLGRQLLDFAERHALEAGYSSIRLYTNEAMSENLALYARRGFVETHRVEENGLRRVHMSKSL